MRVWRGYVRMQLEGPLNKGVDASCLCFLYLENDGWAWFLFQDTGAAEGLKVRIGVVEEVGVVVDQQGLDVVEDEAKLICVLHCVQPWMVLRHQGGGEAAHTGHVQHFTNLERMNKEMKGRHQRRATLGLWLPEIKKDLNTQEVQTLFWHLFPLFQKEMHTSFHIHVF